MPVERSGNAVYLKQMALLRIAQDSARARNRHWAECCCCLSCGKRMARGVIGSSVRRRAVCMTRHRIPDHRPIGGRSISWRPLACAAIYGPVTDRGEADFESWFYLATVASGLNDRDGMANALAGMHRSARTLTQRRFAEQLRSQNTDLARSRSVHTEFDDPLALAQSLMDKRHFLPALHVLANARVKSVPGSRTAQWADCQAKLLLIAGKPESARTVWSAAEKVTPRMFSASIAATYLVERRVRSRP